MFSCFNMEGKIVRNKNLWAAILLLPCILIIGGTVFLPIITTFGYSLRDMNLTEVTTNKFVGFENYRKVLTNPDFRDALMNNLTVLVLVIVLGLITSVFVGVVLNNSSKFGSLLTAIVIIPWALPPLVNGIMWKFIFFPGYGLLNKLLMDAHLINTPISWITSRSLFLFVVAIIIIWRTVPFCAILILANLKNIPDTYAESFELEGGSRWQIFTKITLPLLIPSLGVVLINLTTSAMNVFDEIIALSGYQSDNASLMVYNYSTIFNFLDFGMGSATAYIIMLLVGIVGYFYVKNMTKNIKV